MEMASITEDRHNDIIELPSVEDKSNAEELNILVAVRCRGRNEREIKAKSSVVVDVPDTMGKNEVSINTTDDVGIAAKMNSKIYTVDKVFGPSASQRLVFEEIAEPLFQDFVKGYNCTILVYGMTSTGKTYTMTGDEKLYNGELGDAAGIIPRVLFKLFDTLEYNKDDYLVKCSFVELYNEELKDLLDSNIHSTNNDNKKLRIFDSTVSNPSVSRSSSRSNSRNNSPRAPPDNARAQLLRRKLNRQNNSGSTKATISSQNRFSRNKQSSIENNKTQSQHNTNIHGGINSSNNNSNNNNNCNSNNKSSNSSSNGNSTGQPVQIDQSASIYIQNLEEFHITSAMEGLALLQKGLKQRQVASTKMNDFSSRSHSIFTITLYKEQEGELFRVSKMNLVDLAGSENISRSGAMNQRAKEAGSINQSLLTLGRVINSLADKSEHIPFRESKLTRLLQDSLGGNTKTALIATISPAKATSEETCSTLEYASKAKNIKNKPQLGAFIMKDILVRTITNELAKIKSDLLSTKSKEGVYMSHEHYKDLHYDIECYKTEIEESRRTIESLTAQNESLQAERLALKDENSSQRSEVLELKRNFEQLNKVLEEHNTKESTMSNLLVELQDANSKMQESIVLFQSKQKEIEQSISTFIGTEIAKVHNILSKHINYLQSNSRLKDTDVSEDLKRMEEELINVVKSSETEASKSYDECVKMILDETPKLFDGVSERLNNINHLAEQNHAKLAETLSDVSEEYNNLKHYLKDNFFKNNHEEILSMHVQETYGQLEEASSVLLRNFKDMMESYLQDNRRAMLKNLLEATGGIISNELEMFGAQQAKWEKSSALINECDSLNHTFHNKLENNISDIQDVILSSRDSIGSTINNIQDRTNTKIPIETKLQQNNVIRSQMDSIRQKNMALLEFMRHSKETTTASMGGVNKVEDNVGVILRNIKQEEPEENLHKLEKIPLQVINKENEWPVPMALERKRSFLQEEFQPSKKCNIK